MFRIRAITSLSSVEERIWDNFDHGRSPFLRYGFLKALTESGSIGPGSGWHPVYVLAEDDAGSAVGAVAAFIKTHSYGEYIFDWGWSEASQRAGIPYYPKLVIAAPVTPATGRRVLLAPGVDADAVTAALAAGIREVADSAECSSIHWLFCEEQESRRLADLGFMARASHQFHWKNRDYGSFDDFLAALTSRKRKQIRKERRRCYEVIDSIEFRPGGELGEGELDALDRFYRSTVLARAWGNDYLRPGFFHHLAAELPETMLFAEARRQNQLVAGALFLETERALYGRYWGCDEQVDLLHFEVAYYAGIERCIDKKIPLFEAGAQGEHKLLRGFLPERTYSNHWIRQPQLSAAVAEFLHREEREVEKRMRELAAVGPYRKSDDP